MFSFHAMVYNSVAKIRGGSKSNLGSSWQKGTTSYKNDPKDREANKKLTAEHSAAHAPSKHSQHPPAATVSIWKIADRIFWITSSSI